MPGTRLGPRDLAIAIMWSLSSGRGERETNEPIRAVPEGSMGGVGAQWRPIALSEWIREGFREKWRSDLIL